MQAHQSKYKTDKKLFSAQLNQTMSTDATWQKFILDSWEH